MSEVSEVSEHNWEIWRSFFQMRRQLERTLEQQLQRDAGVSAPDYEILLTVYEAPQRRRRAHEIGELLGWEKSRVSHQVSRMESRGLVERVPCDTDARGSWITLTTKGKRAVLGAMRDHTMAIRRYFFDALTDDDLERLHSVSLKVLEAIDPEVCEILETDRKVAADRTVSA
jgi:DNA-binding MarR family transcriptional regulator